MFINTSLNSSTYTQTNKSSNSSVDNNELFMELVELNKNNNIEADFDFMKLGKVSEDELFKAIDTIKSTMDEVIENVKKEGKGELAAKLTHIRVEWYQVGLNAFNDTLKELEHSSESLNSKDKNIIAKSADDIFNNLSLSSMLLNGLVGITRNFFQIAGISDESIKNEIDKIKKYAFDSEVTLDNGKTVKFENGNNIKIENEQINLYNSSRYMDIFKERKNSLLEDLLKLR